MLMLNRKSIESIKVHDSEEKFVTEPNDAPEIIAKFFLKMFVDDNTQGIETFKGNVRPLNKPIELKKSRARPKYTQ